VEQRQLAWLITTRSQVRVLPPQPRKKDHRSVVLFSWFMALLGSATWQRS
jgi:hypothetical protein